MPRQARKPCSGCGLAVRMRSTSAMVAGPIAAASRSSRVGVHSAWRRCALGMCSGDRRVPVLPRAADVAGDAGAAVEQLDGPVGDAGLDGLAHQAVGHGVEMPVHLDVVVEPGPAAAPLRVGVGLGRQGQQGRPLDRLEQRPAAGAEMAHGPVVEVGDQLADRAVEFGQGEEPAVAQPGQHPALHHLDGDLDLGLVARPAHPGRQHGGAVMRRHVLVGRG